MSANLTDKQRQQLDALLEPHEDRQLSVLAWLRLPSGVPSPRNILVHIERLQRIRAIELPPDLGQRIHQNRLLQLAREGAATTIQHLVRFDDERRYGSLVAVLLETTATLTDEILDLHDRFIGSLFNKAKRKHDEAFQASGKAINEKVRFYAQIGQVLLAAKRDGVDPFAAIEEILSWEDFTRSVSEAERLARPEDFDFLGLITDGYSLLRRYAPTLLETFDFRAAPVVTPLMDAVEMLRAMNRDKVRTIPGSANTDFVSRRWRPYVFTERGIDRRFYELCVLSELKNRLRSGDVWVVGSRQFKDFDTYLLDSKRFAELRDQDRLLLDVVTDGNRYLNERCSQLEQALGTVDALAQRGELPDAAIAAGELKITPLTNTVPEEATALIRQAYALLPHIKITDLLLEVDRWTGFSRHFTHLKTGQPCEDPTLLLTAILADAINLGIAKMAEACPGTTARKLGWLASLYVRDETYAKALAELVNYRHRHAFAQHWGEGKTSSSDGQRFRAGGRGEAAGQVNLRYGNEPGVLFYTSTRAMPGTP